MMPDFFFPMVDPDKQEDAYQQVAKYVGAAPLALGERVYSMTWRHNSATWTATVGETLHGTEIITTGRGRNRREREVPRSSTDTVLAIFPGNPGMIAHDNKSKVWNLPIYTGEALLLVRFG